MSFKCQNFYRAQSRLFIYRKMFDINQVDLKAQVFHPSYFFSIPDSSDRVYAIYPRNFIGVWCFYKFNFRRRVRRIKRKEKSNVDAF